MRVYVPEDSLRFCFSVDSSEPSIGEEGVITSVSGGRLLLEAEVDVAGWGTE